MDIFALYWSRQTNTPMSFLYFPVGFLDNCFSLYLYSFPWRISEGYHHQWAEDKSTWICIWLHSIYTTSQMSDIVKTRLECIQSNLTIQFYSIYIYTEIAFKLMCVWLGLHRWPRWDSNTPMSCVCFFSILQ